MRTKVATKLIEKCLREKDGMLAVSLCACIKLRFVCSVLMTNGNALKRIVQEFKCSYPTAKKALSKALELGLLEERGDNLIATPLYRDYIERKINRFGKRCEMVNVVRLDMDGSDITIKEVKQAIEDAMFVKLINYNVRKGIKENHSIDANGKTDNHDVNKTNNLTCDDIAEYLNISKSAVARRVKRLEDKGLISVDRVPSFVMCDSRSAKKEDLHTKQVFEAYGCWVHSRHNDYSVAQVNRKAWAQNVIIGYKKAVRKLAAKASDAANKFTTLLPTKQLVALGLIASIYDL